MDEIHGLEALAAEEGDDLWVLHAGTKLQSGKVVTVAVASSPSPRSAPAPAGAGARVRCRGPHLVSPECRAAPTSPQRRCNWRGAGKDPEGNSTACCSASSRACSSRRWEAFVLVYLTIDFADRAHTYTGRAWGRAAAELYANKAAVVAYQLAPVALIIAAALLMTLLSRRGELTALFRSRSAAAAPGGPDRGVRCGPRRRAGLVGRAGGRPADAGRREIQVTRFNRWGDWATYHAGSSWVRGKFGRIYHLGPQRDGGWEPATVLEIAQPFRLSRPHRRAPDRVRGTGGGGGCTTRSRPATSLYGGPGGTIFERRLEVLIELFPETPTDLLLRSGPPPPASLAAAPGAGALAREGRPAHPRIRGRSRRAVATRSTWSRPPWPQSG